MRKAVKPLVICIHGLDLFERPEVKALSDKGHAIRTQYDSETDVVIGHQCWRIDPALGHLGKQLEMMLEGVRNIKYPKKKEVKDAS